MDKDKQKDSRLVINWQKISEGYLKEVSTKAQKPHLQALLFYEIGEIFEREIKNEIEAFKLYIKAATLDFTLSPLVSNIERILQARKAFQNLVKVIDSQIKSVKEATKKAQLLFKKAQILKLYLNQKKEAKKCLLEAYQLNPKAYFLLLTLEGILLEEQDNENLIKIYEALEELTRDPIFKTLLLLDIAHLKTQLKQRPEDIIRYLEKAYHINKMPLICLEGIELFARENNLRSFILSSIEGKAKLFSSFLENRPPPGIVLSSKDIREISAFLWFELSYLQEEAEDIESTFKSLEQATTLTPHNLVFALEKVRLAKTLGRLEEALVTAENLIKTSKDSSLPALHFWMAELFSQAQNFETSLSHLNQAFELYPHSPLLKFLIELNLYQTKDWEKLVSLYEKENTKQALLKAKRLAQTKLKDPQKTLQLLYQALDISKDYSEIAPELAQILTESSAWQELISLKEKILNQETKTDNKLWLLNQIGELALYCLNDYKKAASSFKEALKNIPSFSLSFMSLENIYLAQRQWHDLVNLYTQLKDKNESSSLARAYALICADILNLELNQPKDSIKIIKETAKTYKDLESAELFEEILWEEKEFNELVSLLQTQISSKPESLYLLFKLADIFDSELKDTKKAKEIYLEILKKDPQNKQACLLLERICSKDKDYKTLYNILESQLKEDSLSDADYEFILSLLVLFYESIEDKERDISFLTKGLERVVDFSLASSLGYILEERKEWDLFQSLYESLKEKIEESSLRQILLEELLWCYSRNPHSRVKISSLYSDFNELKKEDIFWALRGTIYTPDRQKRAKILEYLAKVIQDPRYKASFMMEAEALNMLEQGLVSLKASQETLKLDPTFAPAILSLPSCLRSEEKLEMVLEALERKKVIVGAEAKVFCDYEQGEIYESLGDDKNALLSYKKVLNKWPDYIPCLEGLRRVAQNIGKWEDFAFALERLGSLYIDEKRKVELWIEAGEVYYFKLQDEKKAQETFEKALDLMPEYKEIYSRYQEILEKRGEWNKIEALLKRQIASSMDSNVLCRLYWKLFEIQKEQLNNLEEAKKTLVQLLTLEPDHEEALDEMADLQAADENFLEAIEYLDRLISVTPSHREQELRLRKTAIFEKHLNDVESAFKELLILKEKNLLDEVGANRILDIGPRLKRWEEVASARKTLAEREIDPKKRINHLRAFSEIQSKYLQDQDETLNAYHSIIEIEPSSLDILEKLFNIYQEREDSKSFEQLLGKVQNKIRERLSGSPFEIELYHTLSQIFKWKNYPDARFSACAALYALGMTEGEEERFYHQRKSQLSFNVKTKVSKSEIMDLFLFSDEPKIIEKVLDIIGPTIFKIFPQRLEWYKVGRKERVSKDSELPVYKKIADYASMLGIEDFVFYYGGIDPFLIAGMEIERPIIIVGRQIKEELSSRERFVLGQILFRLSRHTESLIYKNLRELEIFFVALAKIGYAEFRPRSPIRDLDKIVNDLKRVLGRKERQRLRELGEELQEIRDLDVSKWILNVRKGAARAGLVFAGDLFEALGALIPEWTTCERSNMVEIASLLETSEEAKDLFLFSISEPYLKMRQKLQITLEE